MIITPTIQDKVLNHIVLNSPSFRFRGSYQTLADQLNLTPEALKAIFQDFDERHLIKFQSYMGGSRDRIEIEIRITAHSYLGKGGHVGEFDMIEGEFNKLKTEIYSLEKNLEHNKFEKLTGTINTLIGFFSTLYPKK